MKTNAVSFDSARPAVYSFSLAIVHLALLHDRLTNYSVQRGSYSTHKKDNLFKPFMIVSPNGYILDVFGPFSARHNDASIMKMLLRDERLFSWCGLDSAK